MTYIYLAKQAFPLLGIWPGDRIILRPGHDRAVVLTRVLPAHYGAVLGALEAGVFEELEVEGASASLARPKPDPQVPLLLPVVVH